MSQPPDPTYALVDDLVVAEPLVVDAHLDVTAAAAAITEHGGGCAVIRGTGSGVAVLTDAAIRAWVAAGIAAGGGRVAG